MFVGKYSSRLELNRINQRLAVLEESVFKKVKRVRATEAQRFLILYHLGLIEHIKKLTISQNQKDLLVGIILDIDPNNAKKFLVETSKKVRPLLKTISNYTFLSEFFEKNGHKKLASEAEKILIELRASKDL
jgi:hypothetical protein